MNKIYAETISFIKLFVASAILALIAQIIYEWLPVERFSEENVSNEKISINFGDLLSLALSEFFFFFSITFLILLGVKILYFYFVHRNENKIK